MYGVAVFGDGAAGDFHASGFEDIGELLVRVGIFGVFGCNEFAQGLFDTFTCHTLLLSDARSKEKFELENPAGGLHIFIGRSPADCGFVDSNLFSNVLQNQGPEVVNPPAQEFLLAVDDGIGHFV